MTATTDLDRLITSWLDSDGPRDVDPSRLAETFALTAVSRQRRTVVPFLGPQPWPRSRVRRINVRLFAVAALIGLLVIAGAILLAGTYRRPPTLLGIVEPGPRMAEPVFAPHIVRLSDGGVMIAGTSPDRRVHVEAVDPATGRFQLVPGFDGPASNGGVSLTALPDGSALLVVPHFGAADGSHGEGGAFRITSSGSLAIGFGPDLGDPGAPGIQALGNRAGRLRADGLVEWVDPVPWSGEPAVLFDPATNTFSSQNRAAAVAMPAGYQDVYVATAVPVAGERWLIGGTDNATIFDPATGETRPLRLPIGELGSTTSTIVDHAELLRDGRVFITGSDAGIYDPRDASFIPGPPDLDPTFLLALHDGRLLLAAVRGDPITAAPAFLVLFDPADGSYRQLGDAPLAPETAIAELPDGSLFAVVGTPDGLAAGDAGSTWTMR